MEISTFCKHGDESLLLCVWKQVITEMGKPVWIGFKKKKRENGILQWWRDGERTVGQQRTEMVGGCVWEGLKTLQLYLLVFHLVSQNLRPACWWREKGSQRFSGDSHFCIQVREKASCLLSCSFPVLHAFLWCYRSGSSCACRVFSVSNRML